MLAIDDSFARPPVGVMVMSFARFRAEKNGTDGTAVDIGERLGRGRSGVKLSFGVFGLIYDRLA